MLAAHLFDRSSGGAVDDWQSAVDRLTSRQVLWVDLQSPTEQELSSVLTAFAVQEAHGHDRGSEQPSPEVQLHEDYIHVTSIIAGSDPQDDDVRGGVLESLVGSNWVVTIHDEGSGLVEEFKALAVGPGQVGAMDAPSFLATLLERVVISYVEEFEKIEATLEEFDAEVLGSHDRDFEGRVTVLVQARQRVGDLRRALSPHRRAYSTLSHAELDKVSTEDSAERFRRLTDQVDDALGNARDAKDAVVNSFDVLVLRTENRTNEVVKILTLASVLLLPGSLIAGLMGMNVDLSASDFASSGLFWGSVAALVAIAGTTLVVARARRWI